MTRYELLYIISTTFTDEEAGKIETKVNALLAKLGASVESTKRLGKFRFAYPIKRQRHGYYLLVLFEAERPVVSKIEEHFRITPEILRHLILRADEVGEEQKFDLVQFTEVNVEAKDDRPRRGARGGTKEGGKEERGLKEGVAAIELAPEGTEAPKPAMSSEELEKKIESALVEDVKEA